MSATIFDSESVSVRCPNCDQEITHTVGFFRRSPAVSCPHCHASINLDAAGFDEGMLGAHRTIERARAVEKLSKL